MSGLFSAVRPNLNGQLMINKGHLVQCFFQSRTISTSTVSLGKRNFRKFFLGNKRGTKIFRRERNKGNLDWAPIYTEIQSTGFMYDGVRHTIPEMVPEFIVPDLTGCQLKPYVSYRTADIYQSEFTPQDLFDIVYRSKIERDFAENKLNEDGTPLEPSPMEKLTSDEAWILARKSGSDLFSERTPRLWECLEKSLIDEEPKHIQFSSDDLTHPRELIDKQNKHKLLMEASTETEERPSSNSESEKVPLSSTVS